AKPQTESNEKTASSPVAEGVVQSPDKQAGPSLHASRLSLSRSPAGAPGRARTASMLQRSIGNARLSRLGAESEAPKPEKEREKVSPTIQALSVSSPDDPSEQEAESVARLVTSGQKSPPISETDPGVKRIAGDGEGAVDTSTASGAIAGKGAGSPISPAMR